MKRYHTPLGTGTGLDPTYCPDRTPLMREAAGGYWVMYGDAMKYAEELREEQRAKDVERLQETSKPVERSLDATTQRTNQLLNELYHDRARLEKAIANICELIDDRITLNKMIDTYNDEIDNGLDHTVKLDDLDHDLLVNLTAMAQFWDTHAGS